MIWAGVIAADSIFGSALAIGPSIFVTNTRFEEHLKWSNDNLQNLEHRMTTVEDLTKINSDKLDRIELKVEKLADKLDELRKGK